MANDDSRNSIFRSSNPTLSDKIFDKAGTAKRADAMTIQGTVDKLFVLTVLMLAAATATWVWSGTPEMVGLAMGLALIGCLGGLLVGMVLCFNMTWAPFLAPVYALCQGLCLGAVSLVYERAYHGIVVESLGLTISVLLVLLFAYKTRLIQVTDHFRAGVIAATGAIALLYLVEWILGFFNIFIPYINDSGPIGIAFSLLVVFIASMNFVLDFDFIERGAEDGAPKFMEWYGAFGLLVTLIWVYLEILRLLAKMRRR
ncbi:MAG TPA: Bax inhibitor-1/YccA family protein [bacterium]|nr:Bax inhibitor-1/YccA family protein [bacterium]